MSAPDEPEGDDAFEALLREVARTPSVGAGTRPAGVAPDLQGTELGHYRIEEPLGRGGMGLVHRAWDKRLERAVAIKVLLTGPDPRRDALLREARALAALAHPRIAAVHAVEEDRDHAFLVMELAAGHSLREDLVRGPLPVGRVVSIALDLAEGLEAAHHAGLVHRDLKPENVVVGPDGHAKLVDFGLAQQGTPQGAEGTPVVVGTPTYMAPEQAEGRAVDARTDLFALGSVLHEMLTGRAPFVRSSERATLDAVQREDPPALAVPAAPRALSSLVSRCLAKEPSARIPSARAVRQELWAIRRALGVPATLDAIPQQGLGRPRARAVRRAFLGLALAALGAGGWLALRPRTGGPAHLSLRRLTANPPENVVASAAISPDGRAVAFSDQEGLHLRVLDPPSTRTLVSPAGTLDTLGWFPDGRRLVVTVRGERDGQPALWLVPTTGGPARLLVENGESPCVLPSGRGLVYVNREGLWRANLDGSSAVRRLVRGNPDVIVDLAISPDAARIAFVRLAGAENERLALLEVIGLDGRARRELVRSARLIQPAGVAGLSWTGPRTIVFAMAPRTPRETSSNLWSVEIDPATGGRLASPHPLTDWAEMTIAELSASSDGGRLAFVNTRSQLDVHVARLEATGSRLAALHALTTEQTDEVPSSFAPDGRVLFSTNGDEDFDVRAQPPDGRAAPLLSSRAWETWPVSSPDGQAVLYWESTPTDPTRLALRRVPRAGGPPRTIWETRLPDAADPVGRPPPRAMHFRCARAGRCVLGSLQGADLVFHDLSPETGPGAELLRLPSTFPGDQLRWDLSSDGRMLAVVRRGGVEIRDLESGARESRRLSEPCEAAMVAWSAVDRALYVTSYCWTKKPYRLSRLGPDGQADTLWESTYAWAGYPVTSADGQWIAFAQMPTDTDVWLVDRASP